MIQHIIIAIIGIVVAVYVVFYVVHLLKGKSSACQCGCDECKSFSACKKRMQEKGRFEENAKKKG